MIDSNSGENQTETQSGANGPVSVAKLKEYGKKAYTPLINVVSKYQDEFTPYLNALTKGLQGGVDCLEKESATEAERYVARFFKEAADGLRMAEEKLQSKDVNALSNYLSDFATRKPSVMFGSSYVVGLFFGRLSRHIINSRKSSMSSDNEFSESDTTSATVDSSLTNEPPLFDENIH